MGIFTELGVLYAKYREEKLMEHLKLFATRVNVPKPIRVCDELRQRPWRWLGDGGAAEGERRKGGTRSAVSWGGSDPGSPPPSWQGC